MIVCEIPLTRKYPCRNCTDEHNVTFDGLDGLVPEDGELVAAEVELLEAPQVGERLGRHPLYNTWMVGFV